MKKIFLFFIILTALIGCKNELVQKPKRLIEREKMVNIIYDLSILDAMRIEDLAKIDSFVNSSNQYIYKKHKIDSVQFAQSNSYYAADYKEYEAMYTEVKTRMDNYKAKIETQIKAAAKKKNLDAKVKKKLREKIAADSIKKAKRKLKLKKQADSIKSIKKQKL